MSARHKFVDIAVNLTDCVFRGVGWNGKPIHADDFELVLQRARDNGVQRIIISGTTTEQCERAIAMCRSHPGLLFCTVGVHPANSIEFLRPPLASTPPGGLGDAAAAPTSASLKEEDVRARLERLRALIEENRDIVVAVGEVGLDYAEAHQTPRDIQHATFARQFELAEATGLPMFLHSRDCGMDFVEIVRANRARFTTGVVHSFNGSAEELEALVGMGLSIGLNMSAFRTRETAQLCLGGIPPSRLMLETDAPWCDVRPANFAFPFVMTKFPSRKKERFVMGECVERRNEPCTMIQVLEACWGSLQHLGLTAAASEHGDESTTAFCSIDALATTAYENSMRMFFSQARPSDSNQ